MDFSPSDNAELAYALEQEAGVMCREKMLESYVSSGNDRYKGVVLYRCKKQQPGRGSKK